MDFNALTMNDSANTVTLTINGYDYSGWTSVEMSAGIERQARDFSLGLTWRWPGGSETPLRVQQGDRCEIRMGADLVLTGWIFATPIRYTKQQIDVQISGRSLTADLVDSCPLDQPGQWRNQSIEQVVRSLVTPYRIQVVNEGQATTTIHDHSIQPGETVFKSIDRLLTLSRLFSTDDAQGRLVMARPGSAGRAADSLELGRNILEADAPLDFADVFTEYVCKGQRSSVQDDEPQEHSTQVMGVATDTRVKRMRRFVLHESGQLTASLAQSRATWEREHRISKALAATYKVQGWRQSTGALWIPNQIVRIIDPLIGYERDMLIINVTYTQDRTAGTVTTLNVAPAEGFEPEPNDTRKQHKQKAAKDQQDRFEYLLPVGWEKK